MSDLLVVIFGQELDMTVSTVVLILMLVQLALVAVALVAFVLLTMRKYAITKKKQNILVTHAAAAEKEHSLVGISLDTVVVQRRFKVGEPFNCEGLVVTASYNSEPSTETVTDYSVEAPRTDAEGKPNVTVRYGGFSAYYTVEVVAEEERIPVGMELDTSAVRKEFTAGEAFECAGLKVRVRYNREPLSEEVYNYSVESPATDETGEKQVIVRYGDFVELYNITVLPAKKERHLIGIDLDLEVVKTDFLVGEPFDCSGLGVVARYDEEPYEERVEDFTVEAPDLDRKGMTNVIVRYGEFTQSYPVFVAEGRALVGISLDTSVVRREFTAGEEFNCMGLIVTADYDAEPYTEELSDYEVEAPDMAEEGEREVRVSYLGKTASYTVTVVKPAPAPAPVPAGEETGVLRYDKSFTARLIQSSDEIKNWYTLLKNELLSYKKVKDRMSWKKESYRLGKEPVAKFGFRGNTLCLFLALNPADYEGESRYKVEDVSTNKSFEDTPCMYRIKNDMREKRAVELIAAVMEKLGAERYDRLAEDYYLPYEGIYELVNKGLAKRLIVSGETFEGLRSEAGEEVAADAVVYKKTEAPVLAPMVIEEESVEGGTLRYDKSFRAKVIQSDDETKKFYSAIKNELLSYKKVHDRMSWKRETYKGTGGVVAKISYRGSTLCLFLPLDPAAYADSRYKVEDASGNKSNEDTPCLFRIKNEKRLRLSFDLIAQVMADRGIPKTDRPEEDYAEPYQDIVKLIEQGLVRREISTKEDEKVFGKGE